VNIATANNNCELARSSILVKTLCYKLTDRRITINLRIFENTIFIVQQLHLFSKMFRGANFLIFSFLIYNCREVTSLPRSLSISGLAQHCSQTLRLYLISGQLDLSVATASPTSLTVHRDTQFLPSGGRLLVSSHIISNI
jgi:hypothetical protein